MSLICLGHILHQVFICQVILLVRDVLTEVSLTGRENISYNSQNDSKKKKKNHSFIHMFTFNQYLIHHCHRLSIAWSLEIEQWEENQTKNSSFSVFISFQGQKGKYKMNQ